MNPCHYLFFLVFLFSCTSNSGYDKAIAVCDEAHRQNPPKSDPPSSIVEIECLIGARIPKFETVSLDGKIINKRYFKDSVTVIHFWHIVCTPCINEIQGLNVVASTFHNKPVNFLSIGRDIESLTEQFLQEHTWHFDHASKGLSIIQDIFHLRWELPVTLVVDQRGIIIQAVRGGKSDDRAVLEIQRALIPAIQKALEGHEH